MNRKVITTTCILSLFISSISSAGPERGRRTSYTPSCLRENAKSATIEKIEAIRRAMACRDNSDINYCMEFLGLGAIGVAGAGATAAALKIRNKENICAFKPGVSFHSIWMDYAEARDVKCMSKTDAANRTEGLRKIKLKQAITNVNADLDNRIQAANSEIEKLEQEKDQIIKKSNNEKLAEAERKLDAKKNELEQLRSTQTRLRSELNTLEDSANESRNKFFAIEAEYNRLDDNAISLKNNLKQLEADDLELAKQADHLDSPKGYLDYEDALGDEVTKLQTIVRNNSEYKALVEKDADLEKQIQNEYQNDDYDESRIDKLKNERKEIDSQKKRVASRIKSTPEYIKADDKFNKRYEEIKARQHGADKRTEPKGDSKELREKSVRARDQIKNVLIQKSEIDLERKKLEPDVSRLKQEAERAHALHKEKKTALAASDSQISAKESEINTMRTNSANVSVDSKLVADKDALIESKKAVVRETQDFKSQLARDIPERELNRVHSNTDSLVDKFYELAKGKPTLMAAAANEHRSLLSLDASNDNLSLPRGSADINSRTMGNMKKSFGTFAKSAGIVGGLLGVAGTASATDFIQETVSTATAGDCPPMNHFSAKVYEGTCTRDTTDFSDASERLLFLSNEDIFKEMTLDYNTKEGKEYYKFTGTYPRFKSLSEDYCKLIDSGYNKFYPKVTNVNCGPTITIRTKDQSGTSEFIIEDSNNFPAQNFSFKTGEDHYKLSLSQFGEITKASRNSRTGPSNYTMDLLSGSKNKDTFFGRSDAKQKLEFLGYGRSALQNNIAMLTEVQACCQDTTPRPSTAECNRYGVTDIKDSNSSPTKTGTRGKQ